MRMPPPRATVWLVAVTAAAYLVASVSRLIDHAALYAGFVPARFGAIEWLPYAVPALLTPLTATLVHANLLHIAFNMMMLGFCGRYVEAPLGSRGLLVLYGVGAYGAALAQWAVDPASTEPMVGASGAVSAIVGAYSLLFGQRKVQDFGPIPGKLLHVLWLAAAWIGLQLLFGIANIGGAPGGIAIAAHIGGFLAGLALARPLLLWRYRGA
ncbi:rhomboid family intramembrane serine protease [Sphingomonas quercus]|uniref:Rhomboid family intramembrane serine protease n=1 Tax=Sphingomonas quercus TaxID=2842451 RepID=A0ABS6BEY0_9SPHN|nr:rhomboid family intramembrane serine protease [Sphingomonas quercus]MBU3076392.1 rhomboid family intramembrane serine protease [Sphingomonas quercus]